MVSRHETSSKRPLVIGLTGGIGSGKSTVAGLFRALGTPIIDADEIAHELVEPGQPVLREICSAFGSACLDDRGRLDRDHLRRQVFSNPARRRRLESLLHPIITRRISELIDKVQAPYCIVVIPLLVETGQTGLVDRILVVDATVESQINRVQARNRLPLAEINAIIGAQADREARLAVADDIIVNDGSPDVLPALVRARHEKYLEMAGTL